MSGCINPCVYTEFKLVGNPEVASIGDVGFQMKFAKTEGVEEKEALVYDLISFVAESGGALGLFLGFSFLTLFNLSEFLYSNKQRS